MEQIPVSCPHCGGNKVIRRGKSEDGKHRYLCRDKVCKAKSFMPDHVHDGRKSDTKRMIVEMTLSGIRDVARLLGISTDTVMSELKKKDFPRTGKSWISGFLGRY